MDTDKIRKSSNFIYSIIEEDIKNNTFTDNRVHTRFPPEPNGYLHIGHAKAILLNYNTAKRFNGKFNLRFDDTNPVKEDIEYVQSIKEDIEWLGANWDDRLFFASGYFDQMYSYAVELIEKGLAYVDDLSPEEIKLYRGTLTEPGKNSPYRDRTVEENLELFEGMKNRKYDDGSKVLRAKIDMTSPNINMRDPIIYRILRAYHHNTGNAWCIYPMYDYAHPIEDAIEGVTHSLCSLEFEDHRPFYNWVLSNIDDFKKEPPKQIEFAKLYLTKTIVGKRFLKKLVDEKKVDGWDDPRLMTIAGMRRRGITAEAIQNFCDEIGVAKSNSTVDIAMFEHFVRDDLKPKTSRCMAVLDPIKLVITNLPDDHLEWLEIKNNQDNDELGHRKMPFTKNIYIDRDDFMIDPPKKYHRLYPGNEVRLMGAYFVKCHDYKLDDRGYVTEIHCTYDPETKSGSGFTGRKVKGTLHWVSAKINTEAEFRIYDYLIDDQPNDMVEDAQKHQLNPNSLVIKRGFAETYLSESKPMQRFQFVRHGYFSVDPKHTCESNLVFNLIANLKSSWKPV
ncbi:glutamine--tRNA ligase/YqeY domain fusion protein [Alkalibacter saccharofermentans]|uniref:Glutamine--tRNA ligase n=1 Tax=Alkalibacter saccharofermentans DSM 14828 TaxID=1120975 RepID=A0A1M4XQZ9_9FIRM|nr:glutamine--tRNA ligase/YqeY domain fusion protein [Alkalibacter saccharofermentans]SHE95693.1 glutaminyl-tRNA synthetase [Alkalibacter saccharofermentans DSM 14828]